jgi:hypothetical protein
MSVSLETWRSDANGCSVRGRRIASLKSSTERFSSEKVVRGLSEGNLASRNKPVTEFKPFASDQSVTTRSSWIAIAERAFLARYRTIDLWYMLFQILTGVL